MGRKREGEQAARNGKVGEIAIKMAEKRKFGRTCPVWAGENGREGEQGSILGPERGLGVRGTGIAVWESPHKIENGKAVETTNQEQAG